MDKVLAALHPRKNAKPSKPTTAGASVRNEALRASKYISRAIWRNWSGYHRRSRAEPKPFIVCKQTTASQWMHGVKLLGQGLMARDFDRQATEVHVRIGNMNGDTALRIPVTKTVG